MADPLRLFLIAAATFAGTYIATGIATVWLRRRALLDHPNDRSSHTVPTPRGGGLGVLAVLLPSLAVAGADFAGSVTFYAALVGASALAALSFIDDLRSLPALTRLLAQALAVGAVLATLPPESLVFQGFLPPILDRAAAFIVWLWFVNLFNFMDGIDGISGAEAASIGVGGALVAGLAGGPSTALIAPFLVLAAASIAFLGWNWHPAKVFLGDAGSVPLGFIGGFLLLSLAQSGQWVEAVILPAYYLSDATLTLLRRAARGEKIWRAHRSHFYQRAVQLGRRHDWVVRRVIACNLVLIALACAVPAIGPAAAVIGATLVVAALLITLTRLPS